MQPQNFYHSLTKFKDFLQFADPKNYEQVPDNWVVIITDVRGSTKAIEEGKYKTVNMVGASTIAAIVNSLGHQEFPFVFGGDGATVLIPSSDRTKVESALRTVRQNAMEAFGLELRIGFVSVAKLSQAGAKILVGKYQLMGDTCLAFFKGDGLSLAEKMVKSGEGILGEGEMAERDSILKGLSCRWAPIENERGLMLSILIKSTKDEDAEIVLSGIADQIHRIVDLNSPKTYPVKKEKLNAEKFAVAARNETRLQAVKVPFLNYLKVWVQMVLVGLASRYGLKIAGINFGRYKESMAPHSDFRKFDEILRMVIDCTPQMRDRILKMLETERSAGKILYGTFESASALMTCFVRSLEDGHHIHFVDGSDGGYAMAAKQLKAQMRESKHP